MNEVNEVSGGVRSPLEWITPILNEKHQSRMKMPILNEKCQSQMKNINLKWKSPFSNENIDLEWNMQMKNVNLEWKTSISNEKRQSRMKMPISNENTNLEWKTPFSNENANLEWKTPISKKCQSWMKNATTQMKTYQTRISNTRSALPGVCNSVVFIQCGCGYDSKQQQGSPWEGTKINHPLLI